MAGGQEAVLTVTAAPAGSTSPIVASPPVGLRLPALRRSLPALSTRRLPWLALLADPYLVLGLILATVMWPAWLTTHALVVSGDVLLIHYPRFVLWRDALAAGEIPFWNPYIFG